MTEPMNVSTINSLIQAAGFDWVADQTSVSMLSSREQEIRLGLDIPVNEQERIATVLTEDKRSFTFERKRDWREKDSKNWITAVRDQGACGSCVAFGTIAVIECQARVHYNQHTWNVDLSEADLFFCGAGKNCNKGWWPSDALDYTKNSGISDESCFAYGDYDMECALCSDKSSRLVNIGGWHEVINIDQRKEWLDKKGPMVACMAVYRDFFNYQKGVYKHVTGDLAGYHAVCCIGYDEDEQCWICKNSWGTAWGMDGYFKIAYGQAEMDTKFAMYGVENIGGTLKPEEEKKEECDWAEKYVFDCSFEKNRCVFWAFAKEEWRYRVLTENQVAGLGSWLSTAKAVQICYIDKKIKRILGWRDF